MLRTSRNWSAPRSRFTPLFASLFLPFLGRKAVYPLDNLGASCTNFQFREKSCTVQCIHLSHVFAAFRSFYALESPIAEKLKERFKDRIGPVPKYATSDRTGHRTIQRKSPSSEEKLYVRKKTCKVSEENCIGYAADVIMRWRRALGT